MLLQRGDRPRKKLPKEPQTQFFGKPVKWNSSYVHLAYQLALLGALDKHIAQAMDVEINTITLWKHKHPEFFEAITRGKIQANLKVAESFYLNCVDRYVEEEQAHIWKGKIVKTTVKKYVQGDKWCQHKWLLNRVPELWSETYKMAISNTNTNINIDFKVLNIEELKFLEGIQKKQIPENAGDIG